MNAANRRGPYDKRGRATGRNLFEKRSPTKLNLRSRSRLRIRTYETSTRNQQTLKLHHKPHRRKHLRFLTLPVYGRASIATIFKEKTDRSFGHGLHERHHHRTKGN